MASFEDAALGWTIYRDRGGNVTRQAVNQALRARGRAPISDRTFAHYRKLARLGYSEYVSINRLDLRHANDSIYDVADRSRYLDRQLATPGQLVIPTATGATWIEGTIGKISEGFATLRARRSDETRAASRATKYNRGVLIFEQVDVERAVRVVEGVEQGRYVDLLLEFRSLLEPDIVLGPSPYPVGTARLRLDLGSEASIYGLLDAVHTSFDLFESARGFVDVVATAGRENAPAIPVLRVRRLDFSNPLEALLLGSVAVTSLVCVIVNRVASAVGNTADAAGKAQSVAYERSAERRRDERHQLELQSLQLDNIKKAIEIGSMIEEVQPAISEVAGVRLPQLDDADRYRLRALKDQAVEAATELNLSSRQPIELEQDVDD